MLMIRYTFMKHLDTNLRIIFLLLILIGYGCGSDEELELAPAFDIATEEFDVTYGSHELQTYDLFLPAGRSSESTDVVILIHGGNWIGGDKSDVDGIVDLLQSTMPEYAIANMNYRLDIDPNRLFVDHLDDVDAVITDLMDNNEELGISQRVVLAGVSAGGHMTLLYSYSRNEDDYVKVACNIIGPTDFLDPSYVDSSNPSFIATIASKPSVKMIMISILISRLSWCSLMSAFALDVCTMPKTKFI